MRHSGSVRLVVRRSLILLAVALAVSAGAPAEAQYVESPGRLSLDASLGFSVGDTEGQYLNSPVGVALGVAAALRVRPVAGGGLVVALAAGIQGTGSSTSICLPDPSGDCIQSLPQFAVYSAETGWETWGGTFRALAGPALVRADDRSAAAFMARLDLSRRLLGPVWFVTTGQGTFIPDYRGDSFVVANLSVGVRLR